MDADLEQRFAAQTQPYRAELLRYCRKLCGSEWDCEDLLQEALLKAFRRLQKLPEQELSKPYLYRIAANAWFDICRRRQITFLPELLEDHPAAAYREWSQFDIRESLEYLMDALEPRQVVLILLIDVFGFTPLETGSVLEQPVTAIKAALHRARSRLKKAADRQLYGSSGQNLPAQSTEPNHRAYSELFEAFVQAFRKADTTAMFHAYKDLSINGARVDRVMVIRQQFWFYFKDPDGNMLMVTTPVNRAQP